MEHLTQAPPYPEGSFLPIACVKFVSSGVRTARGKGKSTSSLGARHGSPETLHLARSSLLSLMQAPASSHLYKDHRAWEAGGSPAAGTRSTPACQLREGRPARLQHEGKEAGPG